MTSVAMVLAVLRVRLQRLSPSAGLGFGLLALIVLAALLSPLSGYPVGADVDATARDLSPSAAHWMGTDHLGRDVFWRWVLASRAFVGPGFAAVGLALSIGVSLGAWAGFVGGVVSNAIRFVLGSVASLPTLVFVLLFCTIYGAGTWQLATSAGIAAAPAIAQTVHDRVDALKRSEFVLAAQAHGVPLGRLLLAHLVGAGAGPAIVRQGLATFGQFVVLECTLSYLGGFGVPEPQPSWGNMLVFDWGRTLGLSVTAPALAIWATVAATVAAGTAFAEEEDG
ncbi:MAG: hypothetical protein AAGA48_05350 [Myxococcota bacterium]